MNHKHHKFLTTVIVFVIMVFGIFLAFQFDQAVLPYLTISLLLANSILLLITMGLLHHIKETQDKMGKKPK